VTRRTGIPLLVALACAVGLAVVGALAFGVPALHARDEAILHGFTTLDGPGRHRAVWFIAHLADPLPYALGGLILVGLALLRGKGWRAVAVVILLLGTGGSTQVLKQLISDPRSSGWFESVGPTVAEWPSGHSTAAMTLALCAVLVAPPALRAATAIAGGLFAVGVGYAVLVLGWHFPSDVLGGFLMAGMWTSLAVAALVPLEHRTASDVVSPPIARTLAMAVAGAAALLGGVILAAYGDTLATYTVERPILVVGALAIAALAATLSAGLARAA
jgi:membrane-associated phospholipid phosphatase